MVFATVVLAIYFVLWFFDSFFKVNAKLCQTIFYQTFQFISLSMKSLTQRIVEFNLMFINFTNCQICFPELYALSIWGVFKWHRLNHKTVSHSMVYDGIESYHHQMGAHLSKTLYVFLWHWRVFVILFAASRAAMANEAIYCGRTHKPTVNRIHNTGW